MARCNYCGRVFKSSQSVRAHLRFCRSYQHRPTTPSAPPRARRATTEEEDLRRLFGPAVPSRRTYPAPQDLEPRRAARPSTPPRDPGWSRAQIEQEVRRHWEALQVDKRRRAEEQRARDAQQRILIQEIQWLVVDLYFNREPMPPEALAEAKAEIARTFATLPIAEMSLWERQQIATSVRERVFAPYRKTLMPSAAAVPPPREITTIVHAQPTEVIMPMHRVLTGYFICPRCDEEFELDRMPEKEAVCDDCHVPLEELEEDEDGGDDY
jgi:hypothetical protein